MIIFKSGCGLGVVTKVTTLLKSLRTPLVRCTLNKEIHTRKAFLESAVVELVHKFDEKSTASV